MKQQDIRQIIETYELPPKLEERILHIALRQFDEEGFAGFTEAYNRISHLIDIFELHGTEKRKEKNFLRLDQIPEGEKSLHERIGGEDSSLVNVLEGDALVADKGTSTLGQVVDIFQEQIAQTTFERMKLLFTQYFEMHLGLSSEEIVGSKEVLETRMNEVFSTYVKDGKVVLPPRPIKRITFTPELRIEFGRREYGSLSENPLQFFRDNIDYYAGMGRYELYKVDRDLYLALRKKRQLVQAVPIFKTYSSLGGQRVYRGFESPLAYYLAHPELHSLGRTELYQKDAGLKDALWRWEQLDEAIPIFYRGFKSPLAYYQAHTELHSLNKTQLRKKDPGLYDTLRAWKQLDKVRPYSYRGYSNALAYYQAHPELHSLGRTELAEKDRGLYCTLNKFEFLDQAIPPSAHFFREHESPLAYFKAHGELHSWSKTELSQKDRQLYYALRKFKQLNQAIATDLRFN